MKISVIVPVYNVASYVLRCLRSLLNQNFSDYEVLFVDDCSTDGSFELLQHALNDIGTPVVPIRLFRQDVNRGPGAARNLGMANARGRWCVFVDSDDWVDEDYLANLYAENISAGDLVIGGMTYERGPKKRSTRKVFNAITVTMEKVSADELALAIDYSYPVSKLFDLELIHSSDLKFRDISLNEDTEFVIAYILSARRMIFVNACDYHYVYYNSASLTKCKRKPEEYVEISALLLRRFDGLFTQHPSLARMGLRKQLQKYVLGPLLQALESSYFYYKRDTIYRRNLIIKIKEMRSTFLHYYRSSTFRNALALCAILFVPTFILDKLFTLVSRLKSTK